MSSARYHRIADLFSDRRDGNASELLLLPFTCVAEIQDIGGWILSHKDRNII